MFSHETLYKKLQGNKTNALMSDKEIIGDSWIVYRQKFSMT